MAQIKSFLYLTHEDQAVCINQFTQYCSELNHTIRDIYEEDINQEQNRLHESKDQDVS
jgi:hypothetical protein